MRGKYVVNFIYRSVGTDNECFLVLGNQAYGLGDAQVAQPPPNLPSVITSHCIFVGRIIVSQGASTATQIDSAFNIIFTPGGVTDHDSLTGLQGGTTLQYYHLTSAEYTGTGTGNFVRASGPSVATPTFTTSATFSYLTSGRVPFSTTGGSLIDNANLTYTTGTGLKIADTTAATSTTSAALVVTGGIASGDSIWSGGDVVVSAPSGKFKISLTTITNGAWCEFGDPTNGIVYFGRDNSTGGAFGSSAYGGVFYCAANVPLTFFTNSTKRLTILNTGGSDFNGNPVSMGALTATTAKTSVYTVATLPAGSEGMRAGVSDATATTFASIVAGGGTNHVPVYHNGTNWIIG